MVFPKKKSRTERKKANPRIPERQGYEGRCPAIGKLQFATEKLAKLSAKRARKLRGPKFIVYQCSFCPFWHMGHNRPIHRRRPKIETQFKKIRPGIQLRVKEKT